MRRGAVREEREAEPWRGWKEPLREPPWLLGATGLWPRLRALNPGSEQLQGCPPTRLRMEKLRPGEGARGCTTREVVACRGGFTQNHSLGLSESVLASSYLLPATMFLENVTVFATCTYIWHFSLNCLTDFSLKYDFTLYDFARKFYCSIFESQFQLL